MLWRRRKETDITNLLMRDFKVMRDDRLDLFEVVFHGPKTSLYEGGVWRIRVDISPEYPIEPPKLFFVNPIFHPNIDFISGLICSNCLYWDHIDPGWSPIQDLVLIFQYYIPRLLFDPKPLCPTNHEAAEWLNHDEGQYIQLVRESCRNFVNVEGVLSENSSGDKESGSEESTNEEGSG
ncbi:hypothetical protein K1719_009026 [Acacia pycnantha]|nr:hypothetical protein K1719_009026 [Acacia pycnantha]